MATTNSKPTRKPISSQAVVVTGATAGIGFAIAESFAVAGAPKIVIVGRNPDRADAAAKRFRLSHPETEITAMVGDMTDPRSAQTVMNDAALRLSGIDTLVNATGGDDMPVLLHKQDIGDIPGMIERGMLGQVLASRAALSHLTASGGGSVINIASDAAKIATPGEAVIGAIMAGIVMFTRGLAIEGKRNGIRANAITPSIVRDTPLYHRLMADPFAGKLFGKAEPMAHLGVAEPGDLAALAVFLASPAAARITGQAISVNGGISAA